MKAKISTKLGGGYLALSVLVLIAGGAGAYGVNQLDQTISFILTKAWIASDGAADGANSIQQQVILIDTILSTKAEVVDDDEEENELATPAEKKNIKDDDKDATEGTKEELKLDDDDGKDIKIQLKEAREFGNAALDNIIGSGMIDSDIIEKFKTVRSRFEAAGEQVVQAHDEFSPIDQIMRQEFSDLLLVLADGDAKARSTLNTLTAKGASQQSLRETWLSTEGIMGLYGAMLGIIFDYNRYVSDEEAEEARVGIDRWLASINKMAKQSAKGPLFRNLIVTEGEEENFGITYAAAFTQEAEEFTERFPLALDAYAKLKLAKDEYSNAVVAMLEAVEEIEEIGETQIVGQIDRINTTKVAAYLAIITVLLISFILAITFTVYFVRLLRQAFKKIVDVAEAVTRGDIDVPEVPDSGDEISETLQAMQSMVRKLDSENERLNDSVVDLLGATSRLSERDLTLRLPVAEDVTGPISDSLNMMVTEISTVLREVISISTQVAEAAINVQQRGNDVSNVAEQERKIVQETMASLNQSSVTMNKLAKAANECNIFATQASELARNASTLVSGTTEGMFEIRKTISETEKKIKRLGERSQDIGSVIEIIGDVAERTRVLAVNASMQAAAAGEAGKGFSVVAEEVQRLAESSRRSTSEIAALVRNIQSETAETMAAMNTAISHVVTGTERAQKSSEQMLATKKTTDELAEAIKRIAIVSNEQAIASDKLQQDANRIVESTKITAEELAKQASVTTTLVEFSKRMISSIQVFRLTKDTTPSVRE